MLIQHIIKSEAMLQIMGTAGSGKTHFLKHLLNEALFQKQFNKIEIFSSIHKEEWKEFEKYENVEHINLTEFMQQKLLEETHNDSKLILVDGFYEMCEFEDKLNKSNNFEKRKVFLEKYILQNSRKENHKVCVTFQDDFWDIPSQKISFNTRFVSKKRGYFSFEEESHI